MSGKAEVLETEELMKTKFLKMERIKWRDEDGKDRIWEAANRTTRGAGGVDSVHILALLRHPNRPVSTIVIEQFRPPIGKKVIELPAGLVDEGEDPATTALRELHEETGYGSGKKGEGNAEVGEVSCVLVKDPGMSGANMHLVTVNVNLSEKDEEPEQHLDEGEHIVKRVVPIQDLHQTLLDYDKKGFAIDALIATIAQGYELAKQL